MGKKRNGISNKLKGPAKWQKGSREARKLEQSRRDAKLAQAAKKKEAMLLQSIPVALAATPTQAGHKRYRTVPSASQQPAQCAVCATEQPAKPTAADSATRSAPPSVLPELASAVEQQLATDVGWTRLRNWMVPRLQRCCDVDATVIAQYTSDLLRAKPVEQWPEALPRELATFMRSEASAQQLAAETLSAVCDGSATAPGTRASSSTPTTTKTKTNRTISKKDLEKDTEKEKGRLKHGKKPKKARWVETSDPISGEIYYYHSMTRETTWTRPPDFPS